MTNEDPLDGKIREALAEVVGAAPLAPEYDDLNRDQTGRRHGGTALLAVGLLAVVGGAVASTAVSDELTNVSTQTTVQAQAESEEDAASSCHAKTLTILAPDTNVVVYLEPDLADAARAEIISSLENEPSIEHLTVIGPKAVRSEFDHLFSNLESGGPVQPEAMHSRIEVGVTVSSPLSVTARAIGDAPGVRQITTGAGAVEDLEEACADALRRHGEALERRQQDAERQRQVIANGQRSTTSAG